MCLRPSKGKLILCWWLLLLSKSFLAAASDFASMLSLLCFLLCYSVILCVLLSASTNLPAYVSPVTWKAQDLSFCGKQ